MAKTQAPRGLNDFHDVQQARTRLSELRAGLSARQKLLADYEAEQEALRSPGAANAAIDAAAAAVLRGEAPHFARPPEFDADLVKRELAAFAKAVGMQEEVLAAAEHAAARQLKEALLPAHRESGKAVARALAQLVEAVSAASRTEQLDWTISRLAGPMRSFRIDGLEFLVAQWHREHGEFVNAKTPDLASLPQEEATNRMMSMNQRPEQPERYPIRR
jgi:hypothetical protein